VSAVNVCVGSGGSVQEVESQGGGAAECTPAGAECPGGGGVVVAPVCSLTLVEEENEAHDHASNNTIVDSLGECS
jgi:hypothetical protein